MTKKFELDEVAVANIQERWDKVYILADEDMHKIISPLKEDIKYLLKVVEGLKEYKNG
ncbi:hypothetical protein UFOVP250_79 [uncultured Caudovirales phage]|uniref:Uncharacterized protein n=1 Tax=uncultured Caudovirales phage TaxID=2100421 RepID=A0A6J5LI53_9CAUD|nr:hypothetical protein UFOVP250_79 [uncultured Caudovirales phage]